MRGSLRLKILSGVMAIVFPSALIAADSSATAMLYAHGATLLNGSSVARSSALFKGDFVQTMPDSAASINSIGSTVLILNNSLIQYEGSNHHTGSGPGALQAPEPPKKEGEQVPLRQEGFSISIWPSG